MSQPKEYWIELPEGRIDGPSMVYSEMVDGLDDDAVNVIEKSAYDALQEENKKLKKQLHRLEGKKK